MKMQSEVKIYRFFDMEIGVHRNWLIVLGVITISLTIHLPNLYSNWSVFSILASAMLMGFFYLASVIAGALSYAAAAKLCGSSLGLITLSPFQCTLRFKRNAMRAAAECRVALAGPAINIVAGLFCLWPVWMLAQSLMTKPAAPVLAALVGAGYLNCLVAIFNLLPCLPLNGGYLLRAVIWWITGNAMMATAITAAIGRFVALCVIGIGLGYLIVGVEPAAMPVVLAGLFLYGKTTTGYERMKVEMLNSLREVKVGELMDREIHPVDGRTNLDCFVTHYLHLDWSRSFAVLDRGNLTGLISAREVSEVNRALWPYKIVSDVAHPMDGLEAVSPEISVSLALDVINKKDIDRLAVISQGRIAGVITLRRILQFMYSRASYSRLIPMP